MTSGKKDSPEAKRRVYASFSLEARSMLAIWLDTAPVVGKEQRDPDGWTTGAADTDYLIARLAELAHAPNVDIRKLHGAAAEWWSRIESARRSKASKARSAAVKDTIIPLFEIPPEVEALGLRLGTERYMAKRGAKR